MKYLHVLVFVLGFAYSQGSEGTVDCGTQFTIPHGNMEFTGKETTVNHTVHVTCDIGYQVQGKPYITCLSTGKWSNGTSCQITKCKTKPSLAHGSVKIAGKEPTYNMTFPVVCDEGYDTYGPSYLTCLYDGSWSTNTICHLRDCGKEVFIQDGHADFTGRDTFVNHTVPVVCLNGYEIHGDKVLTCGPTGQWSSGTTCRIKDCGKAYSLPNGHVEFEGRRTTYDERVPVTCDVEYEVRGNPFITCLSDGSWSTDTTCNIRDCGKSYSVPHGHVDFSGSDTTVGHTVPVSCDAGYKISGKPHITCLPDGTWSRDSHCQLIIGCETTYDLKHGYAIFAGRDLTIDHEVPVVCNDGYELHGEHFTTCLDDGNWSRKTSCQIKNCGTEYVLKNGNVDFTGRHTTFGSIVPVTCTEGYEVVGDHFITCLADGTWSKESSCRIKDCGIDYHLVNGYADFTRRETTVHQKAPITCNAGYDIEGDTYTTCLPDGTWSKFTKCLSKDCGSKFNIEHGYVDFTGRRTDYKASVPVDCDVGYDIRGSHYTVCQSDGSWSRNTTCLVKDCGNKYSLDFGYVNFLGMETTYNQYVPVTCDEGYEIIGDHYIKCLADGTWSKTTSCRARDCGKDYVLHNGHVDFLGRQTLYNEKVPVICNEGYDIVGQTSITCLSDGTWSKDTFCRIKDCGTNYEVSNGYVDFSASQTTFNHAARILCNDGYENKGEHHITCGADGTWSKHTSCQLKDCGTQYGIVNGRVNFTGRVTTYKAIVPVTCNDGFMLSGDQFITCLRSGTWNSSECRPKDCGTIYNIEHGHVDFSGRETTFDNTVPVNCDDGYEIQGHPYITCLSDGSWSETTRCRIKDCGTEYNVEHGYANFDGKKTTYNEQVHITCNKGYIIHGDPVITCLAAGIWSTSASCLISDCGTAYHIEHGHVNFDGMKTTYLKQVPVKCDVGYHIVGEQNITCLAGGVWSNNTACRSQDCGTKYSIANGYADFDGKETTYNHTVPVLCNKGYERKGGYQITCLADGTWTNKTSCVIKDCGTSYAIQHGHVDFTGKKTTYQQKVPVSCDVGYRPHGQPSITCLAEGVWSKDSLCVLQDCGTKYTLENGYVSFDGRSTTYNHTVPVGCNKGYVLHGATHTTCLDDGTWSKTSTCVIKDCGSDYNIEHGHVEFAGRATTYQQKVPVICEVGYYLEGEDNITCLANGVWSNNTACRIQNCGSKYKLEHGSLDFSGQDTTYNKTLQATCEDGYEIRGDNKITCLANGTWSSGPLCRAKASNTVPIVAGTLAVVAAACILLLVIIVLHKKGILHCVKGFNVHPEFSNLENTERTTM